MLLNFRFSNFRSFKDEAMLSLEATKNDEYKHINTVELEEPKVEVLKSAIIFGPNASGKSNTIKAFEYMKFIVVNSANTMSPPLQIDERFIFNTKAQKEPTEFEVEVVIDNAIYTYGFSVLNMAIQEEHLYKKVKRTTEIFHRNATDGLVIAQESENKLKEIVTQPQSLFLSTYQFNNFKLKDDVNKVFNWFKKLIIINSNMVNDFDIYEISQGTGKKYKEQALEILKMADIGLCDFSVIKDRAFSPKDLQEMIAFNEKKQRQGARVQQLKNEQGNVFDIDILTKFKVYDEQKNEVAEKNIQLLKDFGFHSEGTFKLFSILAFLLASLDQGYTILVDELDGSLHFLLVEYIIRLFNSINNNIKNAQLICSVHNQLIMDMDLRRDQIYFTSKNIYNESELTCLSDYTNVRKNDLFSKKYLAGLYSLLPKMNKEI